MNEPANHTAWIDRGGDTWPRYDEYRGFEVGTSGVRIKPWGPWFPLTDGPNWEPRARSGIGKPRPWDQVEKYGPFVEADPERTARALARVRWEADN